MTGSDLVTKLSIQLDIPARDARVAAGAFFSALSEACLSSPRVELRGFGTFSAVRRRARPGRNFQTGKPIVVPDRLALKFKPSRELLSALNAAAHR